MNEQKTDKRRFRDAIGLRLMWLVKNGHITEIERRTIECANDPMERESAIYKIVSSKKAEIAVAILQKLERNDVDVKTKACETNKNHPLLNKEIAKHILELLPLKDVLNSRLVCQQWNSTAELIIRKKSTIQFKSLRPTTFLKAFKSIPSVPFASFTISHNNTGWDISELDEFFDKWGKHIKRLKFDHVNLKDPNDPGKHLRQFNITRWIKKTTNLKELKIELVALVVDRVSIVLTGTNCILAVEIDALKSVENLFVSSGGLLRLKTSGNTLVTPRKITFNDGHLKKQNQLLMMTRLNEFIDFSRASEIKVFNSENNWKLTLNMASQVFKLKSLYLMSLNLENWNEAKGRIFFLYLRDSSPFLHANQLQIQQLLCSSIKINLAALPNSLEKLHFSLGVEISCSGSCQLPNLNFLGFTDHKDFKEMTNFAYCDKLVEIHLSSSSSGIENVLLHVNWVPKSVKIMKINCKIVVVAENGEGDTKDENTLVLDKLILENYLDRLRTDVVQILTKIKPKVLVVSCFDLEKKKIDTTDIIRFVFENRQLGEIIVGADGDLDLHKDNSPFEDSLLSNSVDAKANYYHFKNRKGKSLTRNEFGKWRIVNGMDATSVNKYRRPIVGAKSAHSGIFSF